MEIPESCTLADQLKQTVTGKTVHRVIANQSPHKFAWFFGDPAAYSALLCGKRVGTAQPQGGNVELCLEDARLLFQDGVNLRYLSPEEPPPKKHQLYLEFSDGSALVSTVQMYGGLAAFLAGQNDNPYYLVAKEKPSPLSQVFDEAYFYSLLGTANLQKLSAKAFLATEQRIPGLGNGVLQDILFTARVHPKRKMSTFSDLKLAALYQAVKSVLSQMALHGGRDTERDLFGCPGGYKTILSKNTAGKPCPVCGGEIQKQSYLGGSVYVCPHCQPLDEEK